MFACRVLVGGYCQGKKDQPTPDVRQGTELYDSTVDNVNTPQIFVAPDVRRRTRNTSSPSKRTLINSLINRVQGRTIFVVQHRNQTYLIAYQASTKRDLIHGQ